MSVLKIILLLIVSTSCFITVLSRGRHVKIEHVSKDKRQLHVKLFYTAAAGQQYAVRNANTATGDGTFSVANGGCGGANTFGSNGVTEVADGAKVTLRIAYNGGHASQANQFKMYYGCGAENTGPTVEVPAANCDQPYPATAPQGSGDGPQTISCTLPPAPAGQTDCAVSLQDQRNWGGCADLKITPNAAPGNPPPGGADNTPPPSSGADGDVIKPSGNQEDCCSLSKANIKVKKISDDKFEFSGTASGTCTAQSFDTITLAQVTATMVLDKGGTTYRTQKDNTGKNIIITYSGGEEPFEISLNENVLQFTNMGLTTPKICDGKIVLEQGNNADIVLIVVIIIVVLVICCAAYIFIVMRRTREYEDEGNPTSNPAVATKAGGGGGGALPSGWDAVVDKESGDTYYHNKKTGETTWDKPTVRI
jgi:hypothetical protein